MSDVKKVKYGIKLLASILGLLAMSYVIYISLFEVESGIAHSLYYLVFFSLLLLSILYYLVWKPTMFSIKLFSLFFGLIIIAQLGEQYHLWLNNAVESEDALMTVVISFSPFILLYISYKLFVKGLVWLMDDKQLQK